MRLKSFILFLFLLLSQLSFSQAKLSLNEAITIALEENLDIQISQLEQTADAMQVFKSNAGFGPTLDWDTRLNSTGNYVNQQFLDGRKVDRWGRSFSPGTSLNLGLMLYDGGRAQANYDQLGLLGEFSQGQSKVIIQRVIADVMQAYYNITRQKKRVEFTNIIIKYYQERLTITEQRWKIGKGSKLDFLQSKTDLNAQLSEIANAKNDLKNAKVLLNGILNRPPNEEFIVEEINNADKTYNLEELIGLATTKNKEILLLQKSFDISLQQEVIAKADRKPRIDFSSSLGYNYSNNNAGFVSSNNNLFLNIGFAGRWNLYDGNLRKNRISVAEVNTRIVQKQQAALEAQITNELHLAYNQYINDRELLSFEEDNKTLAEENLSISLEKFRLGGSTILELNEAQRTYDTALNRLVTAQYNIKISELDLLRLSGSLVE